jgi:hypothetical protein
MLQSHDWGRLTGQISRRSTCPVCEPMNFKVWLHSWTWPGVYAMDEVTCYRCKLKWYKRFMGGKWIGVRAESEGG